jgi:hypothetical protein
MAPSGKDVGKAETQWGVFATTHWSVVLEAVAEGKPGLSFKKKQWGQIHNMVSTPLPYSAGFWHHLPAIKLLVSCMSK